MCAKSNLFFGLASNEVTNREMSKILNSHKYLLSIPSTLTTSSTNQSPVSNPLVAIANDQSGCPQHRALLLDMCSLLHTIVLRCTGALVWHHFGEGRHNSMLCGSPLDLLPVPSSSLPMAHGLDNQIVST